MRLPNPLFPLRKPSRSCAIVLATACNEGTLTLLEKAVTKAHDDKALCQAV